MSIISLRLSNHLLSQLDNSAHILHIQRAEYIRRAIEYMNREVLNQERKNKLIKASFLVRQNSMSVNNEFSDIEHDTNL